MQLAEPKGRLECGISSPQALSQINMANSSSNDAVLLARHCKAHRVCTEGILSCWSQALVLLL